MLTDAIVPRAVDSLDLNEVIGEIDLDRTLERVDLDALLARLDLNALIARVDLNAVLSRLDLNALLSRVDIDQLVDQIDVDSVVARVDMMDIVKRVQIDAIVTATASGAGYQVLDLLRRQLLGLDVTVTRIIKRIGFKHVGEPATENGSFTGQLAGAASRLFAFLIDAGIVFLLFAGIVAVGFFLASLFVGHNLRATSGGGLWHILGLIVFGAVYYWIGLDIAGRTVGMLVAGLRVVAPDRSALRTGPVTKRVVVFPFSFILGLGLIGIVIGRQHRALHDVAAPSIVVYDWGQRDAEMGKAFARLLTPRELAAEGRFDAGERPPAGAEPEPTTTHVDAAPPPVAVDATDGSRPPSASAETASGSG
jgi:uncharacterized RDD family membrane protein YckC